MPGVMVSAVLLVGTSYEERRSYAIMRKLWPELEVVYADSIGDVRMVIDMIVGALQMVSELGFRV